MNKRKTLLILFLCLVALTPFISGAQTLLPQCALSDEGICGPCQIIQTALNFFRWILGIVGGLALLLFVWHGFGWLTSLGNSEKVKKTGDALKHTVIGIVIILASWLIVNLVVVLLTFDATSGVPPKIGTIFSGQPWNNPEFCE